MPGQGEFDYGSNNHRDSQWNSFTGYHYFWNLCNNQNVKIMSTRANIKIMQTVIIKDGRKKNVINKVVWLYHHHDGYPSFLGATLWEWLNNMTGRTNHCVSSLATELVKKGVPYNNGREDVMDDEYEITTGRHGDIEYLYEIKFPTITRRTVKGRYEYEQDENDIRFSVIKSTYFRGEDKDVVLKSGLVNEFADVDWEKSL